MMREGAYDRKGSDSFACSCVGGVVSTSSTTPRAFQVQSGAASSEHRRVWEQRAACALGGARHQDAYSEYRNERTGE